MFHVCANICVCDMLAIPQKCVSGMCAIYVCVYIYTLKSGAGERVGQLTPACQTAMETGVCVTQCVLALTHGMGKEACAAC